MFLTSLTNSISNFSLFLLSFLSLSFSFFLLCRIFLNFFHIVLKTSRAGDYLIFDCLSPSSSILRSDPPVLLTADSHKLVLNLPEKSRPIIPTFESQQSCCQASSQTVRPNNFYNFCRPNNGTASVLGWLQRGWITAVKKYHQGLPHLRQVIITSSVVFSKYTENQNSFYQIRLNILLRTLPVQSDDICSIYQK